MAKNMKNTEDFELDELVALAKLDIEEGRVEKGLGKLKRILANPSVPAEALSMAARLYARLGLFERAQPLFEQFLAANPGALEEEFQLGMVQFDRGQAEGALKVWEGILQRQPVFPPGLFFSALVLSRQGKIAEARRNLDVLLQTAPADNLYFERGKELMHALDQGVSQVAAQAAAPQAYQA